MPAGRISGLTTSPTRSTNCSTAPAHAGIDHHLVEFDLRLLQRGLRTRLFSRQLARELGFRGLLGGKGRIDAALAALDHVLQALDLTPRHDVGVTPVQLLLGRQLIDGLLEAL